MTVYVEKTEALAWRTLHARIPDEVDAFDHALDEIAHALGIAMFTGHRPPELIAIPLAGGLLSHVLVRATQFDYPKWNLRAKLLNLPNGLRALVLVFVEGQPDHLDRFERKNFPGGPAGTRTVVDAFSVSV